MIKVSEHKSEEYRKALELRLAVLRYPLGMNSFTQRELYLDVDSIHITALAEDKVIGTLILTRKDENVMKMRQVCVDPDFQSQAIGRKMVAFSEKVSKEAGANLIELHARANVVGWYQKLGFVTEGEEFFEVGIPHFKMKKVL